jgi:hypothetical protein
MGVQRGAPLVDLITFMLKATSSSLFIHPSVGRPPFHLYGVPQRGTANGAWPAAGADAGRAGLTRSTARKSASSLAPSRFRSSARPAIHTAAAAAASAAAHRDGRGGAGRAGGAGSGEREAGEGNGDEAGEADGGE